MPIDTATTGGPRAEMLGHQRSIVTDAGTYTLRARAAKLSHVVIWAAGTGWSLTFYDETTGSGSEIWGWVTATGIGIYALQIPCATGLTVVSAGTAGKATIVWD